MDEQTDFHRMDHAMNRNALNRNAKDLDADLEWLAQTLQRRLADYFAAPGDIPTAGMPPPPEFPDSDSPYADLLRKYNLSATERLVLLLALAPTLRPQLLDVLLTRNETTQRGFTEFGGTAVLLASNLKCNINRDKDARRLLPEPSARSARHRALVGQR